MATKEQKRVAFNSAIEIGKEFARSTTDVPPGNVIKDTYTKILELIEETQKDD